MTQPCTACGVPTPGVKPPPIVLSVDGIAPKPIVLTPEAVNWGRLTGLPAFDMFLAERHSGKFPGPGHDLYSDYCAWHEAKGYWPNETPMGEVKE